MSELSAPKKYDRGWGWPSASKKAHYFIGTMSMCGKWAFSGELDPPTKDMLVTGDECAACLKKLKAEHDRLLVIPSKQAKA